MNDKISELIIAIKNAGMTGNTHATLPASKFKKSVLLVLKKEGYITDFEETGKGVEKSFSIELKYDKDGNSAITDVKRVSKLSKRVYKGYRDILPVKYGHGHMILSTPKGIMTALQAKKEKTGGEALFIIW